MTKRTLLALLVFAGLLAAAIYSLQRKPERNITRISFAGLDKEQVDRLEISGKNPIEASKKDGKWVLGDGRDAEESAVKGALDAIGRIESADVVTTNPDRFAELEVDETKGTRVRALAGGKTVAELVIGKADANGTYVREGDAVYTVKGVSSYTFSRPSAQWHRLKLFEDKLEDVSRVEVALAGEPPYALVKQDDAWGLEDPKILPEGFRFDAGAARGFVASLVNATAKDVAATDPGPETTRLADKPDLLAFVGKDGARRELRLGANTAEAGGVYVQVAGKADVFTLAEHTAKTLRRKALDLRDLTLMKLEKEKVQKLEIADGKTRLVLEKQGAEWKIATSSEPIPSDFVLDPGAVERRLGTLSTARALKLAPAGARAGLEKPSATLTATLEGGGKAVLAFGASAKEDNQEGFFARGNADGHTYFVAKWVRDQLTGGLATFKQPPPQQMPAFDPSALQNLPPDVRANLMQQLARQHPTTGPGATLPPAPPPKPSSGAAAAPASTPEPGSTSAPAPAAPAAPKK